MQPAPGTRTPPVPLPRGCGALQRTPLTDTEHIFVHMNTDGLSPPAPSVQQTPPSQNVSGADLYSWARALVVHGRGGGGDKQHSSATESTSLTPAHRWRWTEQPRRQPQTPSKLHTASSALRSAHKPCGPNPNPSLRLSPSTLTPHLLPCGHDLWHLPSVSARVRVISSAVHAAHTHCQVCSARQSCSTRTVWTPAAAHKRRDVAMHACAARRAHAHALRTHICAVGGYRRVQLRTHTHTRIRGEHPKQSASEGASGVGLQPTDQ